MSNLKLFADVDETALDETNQEMNQNTGSEFMKLVVGKNTARFLPPLASAEKGTLPSKVIFEHFIDGIGTEGGTFRFVCPRSQTKGKGPRCPVCDEADRMRASGNVLDTKKAGKMYPSKRIYCNVINRKAPELGPRILSFGKSIWDQLEEIRKDKEDGGVWWNPGPKGFDVNIYRKGQGKNDTEYTCRIGKRGPLHEDEDQVAEWAERMLNLGGYAALMDPEELVESLGAEVRGARKRLRDTSEDEAPRKLSSGNGKSGKLKRPKHTAQETIDADYTEADADGDDVPY